METVVRIQRTFRIRRRDVLVSVTITIAVREGIIAHGKVLCPPPSVDGITVSRRRLDGCRRSWIISDCGRMLAC